jgi:hypothetical protein
VKDDQVKGHKDWGGRKNQGHTDDYDVFDKGIKDDLHQGDVSGLGAY